MGCADVWAGRRNDGEDVYRRGRKYNMARARKRGEIQAIRSEEAGQAAGKSARRTNRRPSARTTSARTGASARTTSARTGGSVARTTTSQERAPSVRKPKTTKGKRK